MDTPPPMQLQKYARAAWRRMYNGTSALFQRTTMRPAGRPGGANPWFKLLKKQSTADLFPAPSEESARACDAIKQRYADVIAEFGVDYESFFGGSIKDQEAHALHSMIRQRKPQAVYQIGTFIGYSAMIIADALERNGSGRLIAMDPEIPHRTRINPVNVARRAAQVLGLQDIITFERGWHSAPIGDDLDPEWKATIPVRGPQVLADLPDYTLDFAFIDGDHSSAMTIMDFMSLKEKLSVGGIAVFHDAASWPTVAQAIWVIWHDILFYRKGTKAYFHMDVRRGFDGLAALERIKLEQRPTLKITIEDETGAPLPHVKVTMPALDWQAITDSTGAVYAMRKIPKGTQIHAQSDHASAGQTLGTKVENGFVAVTLRMGAQNTP
ncbi:MAG: class I SAM-dependent methyltransferase [Sulfitobacter sp.]